MAIKTNDNQKFYFVSQYPAINEARELFTWMDACEIVSHYQKERPELHFIIQEFEPI